MTKDRRWCLICNAHNRTLYWHKDKETQDIWCFCNKCDRGYGLAQYCQLADIDYNDFLSGDFYIEESSPNEVQAMVWPTSFIPLSDPRASQGVEYIKSRGLSLDGDMYYDMEDNGIVLPYYFGNHYCGAQVRFIEPKVTADGKPWKITTVPGTRIGLLFGMWNQSNLLANIKAVVVCEGFFNALCLQQAFNLQYGSVALNPWKFISTSGSGATEHQQETLRELVEKGYQVIAAPDSDEAGLKMYEKLKEAKSITHYAFTGESDWNDILKQKGYNELARFFIKQVKAVD